MPVRRLCVCRELTKVHEEVIAGTPTELLTHFTSHPSTIRGEFVIIVTK